MTAGAALRLAGCCVVLLCSACIRSDLHEVGDGDAAGDGTGIGAVAEERTELGEAVTTASGNVVTVERIDDGVEVEGSDLLLVSARVEICAGDDGDGATVNPEVFRAVVEEGYRRPAPSRRTTPLEAGEIEAGECVGGWVGFPVRPGEDVEGIVLLASTVVEWSVT